MDHLSNNRGVDKKRTDDQLIACSNKSDVVRIADPRSNKPAFLPPTIQELKHLANILNDLEPMLENKVVESPRPVSRQLRRRFPPEVIQEIAQAYRDGKSTTQLRKEYEISMPGLLKLLREEGVEMRSTAMSKEIVEQAAELYWAGQGVPQIAEQLGVSRQGLRRVLVKQGIAVRGNRKAFTRNTT